MKVTFKAELNKRNSERINKLLELFGPTKDKSILEVGIGNGRFGILLADKFKSYFGIDRDPEYLDLALKNKPPNAVYQVGDALDIPFDKKFDFVFYSFSFHFIKNKELAIKEALQDLSKHGKIIILEPKKDIKWADPKLNIGSDSFNQESLDRKLKQLEDSYLFLDANGFKKTVLDSGVVYHKSF